MSKRSLQPAFHGAAAGLLATLALVCGAGYAAGQHSAAASAAAGRQVAKVICSSCHIVAGDQEIQPILKQPTPSFQQVADEPRTTPRSLSLVLNTTHWDEKTIPMTMPARNLTEGQTDEVIAYIMSLRGRR